MKVYLLCNISEEKYSIEQLFCSKTKFSHSNNSENSLNVKNIFSHKDINILILSWLATHYLLFYNAEEFGGISINQILHSI